MNEIYLVSIVVCSLGYFVNIGSFEIFISIKADTLFLIINTLFLIINTLFLIINTLFLIINTLFLIINSERLGYH